jgi:hypothetical protein
LRGVLLKHASPFKMFGKFFYISAENIFAGCPFSSNQKSNFFKKVNSFHAFFNFESMMVFEG